MAPTPVSPHTRNLRNVEDGVFDICILGGGILGACAARDASLRGYRVLLLEAQDYAQGTSSRSSKLLHGGVRYLEQGDIGLVSEALAERSIFFAAAPHIVRPQKFLYPIIKGMTRPKWQVRIGLAAYDYLSRILTRQMPKEHTQPFHGHEVLRESAEEVRRLQDYGLNCLSLLAYVDGQMEDTRLVIENILDAELLGARTFNHIEPIKIEKFSDSAKPLWRIALRCKLSGEEVCGQARYLVNATGPWLKQTHELLGPWPAAWPNPVYSRGTHLLFHRDLGLPGLILPTGIPSRYYFVIPYFSPFGSGTLVGTTDRAVPENETDPQPDKSEVAELLGYLKRDLPKSGLDESSMYHSFCGMRVIAGRASGAVHSVSQLSRREEYLCNEAYLAVLGGKYTTARHTAEKLLDKIESYFGPRARPQDTTRTRPLPGGCGWSEQAALELRMKLTAEISQSPSGQRCLELRQLSSEELAILAAERARVAVSRFGMRALLLLGQADHLLTPDAPFLRSEVALSLSYEQSHSIKAAISSRLGVEYQPGFSEKYEAWLSALNNT